MFRPSKYQEAEAALFILAIFGKTTSTSFSGIPIFCKAAMILFLNCNARRSYESLITSSLNSCPRNSILAISASVLFEGHANFCRNWADAHDVHFDALAVLSGSRHNCPVRWTGIAV